VRSPAKTKKKKKEASEESKAPPTERGARPSAPGGRRPCPSFFKDPSPGSVAEVYFELRCEGRYAGDVPGGGGYEEYFRNLKRELGHDPIGGHYYPQFRVAKAIAAIVQDSGAPAAEELQRLQDEWEATGRPFWEHFYDKATRDLGVPLRKVPFTASGASSALRELGGAAAGAAAADAPGKRSARRGGAAERAAVPPAPPDPRQEAYVEETAFLYHDPLKPRQDPLEAGVADEDLRPLPPPPPLPGAPAGCECAWSSREDGDGRFVTVDFRRHAAVPAADRDHFARLAERDDVVLVAEGVLPGTWTHDFVLGHVRRNFASRPFYKFRRFDRLPGSGDDHDEWTEADDHAAMRVDDFLAYVRLARAVRDGPGSGAGGAAASASEEEDPTKSREDRRGAAVSPEATAAAAVDPMFTYVDPRTREPVTVDVKDTTFYMIDIEMYEAVPDLDDKFRRAFKLEDFYPGGELDLMKAVSKTSARSLARFVRAPPCGVVLFLAPSRPCLLPPADTFCSKST
jgi:hypothetical protein